MRRAFLIAVLAVLSACPPATPPNPPPTTQFYFPTGLAHVDAPLGADGGAFNDDGILFVANANFDKRFDTGSLMAIDLSLVGTPGNRLPKFGDPVGAGGPKRILEFNLTPSQIVAIAPFAGELVAVARFDAGFSSAGLDRCSSPTPVGAAQPYGYRLFTPTRSENNRLYAIDAPAPKSATDAPSLVCVTTDAGAGVGQDCTATGQSLTALELTETGIPRAPSPIGVAVSQDLSELWVTSMQQADTPRGSLLNPHAYLVHVCTDQPRVDTSSFVDIGIFGPTNSVTLGQRYAYVTGRYLSPAADTVRLIDTALNPLETLRSFSVFDPGLENTFEVLDTRGVALASDESRLYVAARNPDSLVIASIVDKEGPNPLLRVAASVPLCEGAELVRTIPRAGHSDLVVVTCATAGALVFYDDEVGNLVAQVQGVGLQPFAIAVDLKGSSGARLYVSNFTDGRVAVVDVPDLLHPGTARIVAFLGDTQLCITRGAQDVACDGGMQ